MRDRPHLCGDALCFCVGTLTTSGLINCYGIGLSANAARASPLQGTFLAFSRIDGLHVLSLVDTVSTYALIGFVMATLSTMMDIKECTCTPALALPL